MEQKKAPLEEIYSFMFRNAPIVENIFSVIKEAGDVPGPIPGVCVDPKEGEWVETEEIPSKQLSPPLQNISEKLAEKL